MLENLDEKLEGKIDLSIRNVLPDIVKECIGQILNQMNETVSKSMVKDSNRRGKRIPWPELSRKYKHTKETQSHAAFCR